MIKPELTENRTDFIKRGFKDADIIALYPDTAERTEYLLNVFKLNSKNHLIGPKGDKGDRGEKGEQGLRGNDGVTPVKGIDYFTNKEIDEIKTGIFTQIKVPEPKAVTVLKQITPEERQSIINETLSKIDFTLPLPSASQIKQSLESLKGDKRLDASAIKNLPQPKGASMGGGGITRYAFSAVTPLTYNNQSGLFILNYASGLSLTGNDLTNDLITGKAGGQTIYGGTAASENLTLISTSHATKGSIIIGATNQIVVSTSGAEFGSSVAATHPITLPSASTGMAFYNTADQTTNYERYVMQWSSNIFQIIQEFGGSTNAGRIFRIKQGSSSTVNVDVNSSAASPTGFVSITRSTSGAGTTYLSTNGTSTASSGVTVGIAVNNAISHSGTAGYTAILANITESGTGSGPKLLMDLQVGTVSKFKVDNAGNTTLVDAANIAVGTSTGTKIGTATSQKLAFWNKTPIVQPTTGITGAAFTQNSGTAVNDASTFGGYTIKQLAAILINTGLTA